ncbi:oxygenase MpaB family protein [Nocardia sp. NPDC005825]|uniref:oxygenase MpaB family protein n=1 Tax=unclassified Nocardia TaxID=2637762 RepID=UPI0033E6BDF8
MTLHYPELAERVRGQRAQQPDLYGAIDFDRSPYRFTSDPEVRSALRRGNREPLLADDGLVELIRTGTMLGDVVADPYAALLPQYGLHRLMSMLRQACREGIDAVVDAPEELRAFIASMEATPAWVDMDLVEQGARAQRVSAAFLAPFLIRGAFMATFANTYAALPMALTGALSDRRAERRVNETANFFAVTTLQGALERDGLGFEAAAMVRLMHSMVRYNALQRSTQWDPDVYGVPIPQVDQMPAGLIEPFRLAMDALSNGRTEFTARERAVLELCRYRCFLLGLPEELLPTSAADTIRMFSARSAMLRDGFDDSTCGELMRSTMGAYLRPSQSRFDRIADAVERSWSKAFFYLQVCRRDKKLAASMGVHFGGADMARVAATAPFILVRFLGVRFASGRCTLSGPADRYTQRVLERRLATYGNPEFTTDAHAYPTTPPAVRQEAAR